MTIQAASIATATRSNLPSIRLKPRQHRRLLQGHPWIYSNEIEMDVEARALAPGELVQLVSANGEGLGIAIFNRLPLISARLLTRDVKAVIDTDFLIRRIHRALEIRERLIDVPYYRLVHAEADGLPGVVIDRFGHALVLQVNTAGMDRLLPELLAALEQVLAPDTIVLRNEGQARLLEGLEDRVEVVKGRLDGMTEVAENGVHFLADLEGGQKTGWFFDQRDNRAEAAKLAAGARVLDCYAFTGGFGVLAACRGAQQVELVDRSEAALEIARRAAEVNGTADRCRFVKATVFQHMRRLHDAGERYGLVIADPPAFVKSRKDLAQGEKGYRKLSRLAAGLVRPAGYLVIASCSHHVDLPAFSEQIRRGLNDAGRSARFLRSGGAAADHPMHPALKESGYLKALFIALD